MDERGQARSKRVYAPGSWERLHGYYRDVVVNLCETMSINSADLWSTTKHRNIIMARRHVQGIMRCNVASCFTRRRWAGRANSYLSITHVEVFEGAKGEFDSPWGPVSYTILSELTGKHHTTFVLAERLLEAWGREIAAENEVRARVRAGKQSGFKHEKRALEGLNNAIPE